METWKLYAFAAAFFAGITAILAKAGMKVMGADVGLALRTVFVFGFILVQTLLWTGPGKVGEALLASSGRQISLLVLSALATTLSWICYYRAMQHGSVAFVSLVDKGSILVTMVLSVLILGEPFTARMALGGGLVLAGILVLTIGK